MLEDKIIDEIKGLLKEKERVLIAIEGRCGSGKTTLAKLLQEKLFCDVIHLDDFFLRPEQRTPERLNTPGANVDYERFLSEVMIPLKNNQPFSYRPFICRSKTFGENIEVKPGKIMIVEGVYSCHPELKDYFDLHIFLDVSPEEQMRRITERNGEEGARAFREMWIPLEEKYFSEYNVKENCELKYNTDYIESVLS